MTDKTLAELLAGGGRFVRWDDLGTGTVVAGVVTATQVRQARVFGTSDPDTWDDGTPKMQAVIELQTTFRDPQDPDDDGRRNVVVNLWSAQKKALADACRKADVAEPKVGDTFEAVWTSGAGGARDPRVFAYRVTPGTGLAAAIADNPPAAAPADPFTQTPRQPDVATQPAAPPAPAEAGADPLAALPADIRAALANLLNK